MNSAPANKLRVGLVGLHFGKQILQHMLLSGPGAPFFEVAGICDLDREAARAAAAGCSARAFPTYEEMLADATIPVVVLITAPGGRAELIRKAVRAGKDVITTKPFELDPTAAASVLAEARQLGRMVYMNSPCASESRDFRIIREWREKHDLGRPVAAHHECWYKSVENADGSWYDDPDRCPVAPIFRLGIYGINDLVRIFGEPEEVQVIQSRIFTGKPTPDLARMQIKFRDGSLASLMNGWVPQPARGAASLTLYFENGTIYRNPVILPQVPMDSAGKTLMALVTKDRLDGTPLETVELDAHDLSSDYQWDVFHRAFSTRIRPEHETPDEAVVNSIRIVEKMREADARSRS